MICELAVSNYGVFVRDGRKLLLYSKEVKFNKPSGSALCSVFFLELSL